MIEIVILITVRAIFLGNLKYLSFINAEIAVMHTSIQKIV
jgi:hypothetical protein